MNDKQRLHLQNMIKDNNVQDQTELIRTLKHSHVFRMEIDNMIKIKDKYRGDYDKISEECINECSFLFTYYTDIFNKLKKDEIDINILNKFVDVLRKIEENELDQHEASFLVGTILKELYIDSALKKADKLNENAEKPIEPIKPNVQVSWKQYKTINNIKII